MQNQQLAEELRKPIIRKFEKQTVHLELADMQLISKYDKGYQFLFM